MSQSAIGRAALVLTTNASGLRSGLAGAGQDAVAWADRTGKAVNARLKEVGRGLSPAGFLATSAAADRESLARLSGAVRRWAAEAKTAIASVPGGGLVSGLVGSVPKAAVAAAGIVGSVATVKGAMDTLNDVARGGAAAKAFGLTAEQFTGIAGVAKSVGEDTREFIESLVTLGKVASEGAAGKGEVAPAWFAKLNLDAQKFKALRLDEQFLSVFEAIQKVEDPAERVRALMVAFGEDGGKYLLPLLAKAPAEIRALAGGFAISAAQVGAATQASQAFTRAQTAIQALWRRIAVAAAPVLEFVANELTRTVGIFSKLEDTAVPAMAKILKITAQVTDATKALTAATLIATGLRLKFASAEVGYHAAMAAARTGVGAVAAGAVGATAAGLFEASGLGQQFRDAGNFLYSTGTTLLRDVGGAAKRAEAFVSALEKRKGDGVKPVTPGKGGKPPEPEPPPPPPPVVVKVADNTALIRGSVAEVTARLNHEFGTKTAQDRLLEEQKRGTKLLGDISDGIKSLLGKPAAEFLGAV